MSLITGQNKDKHLNSIQAKRELISKFDSFLPVFDEADIINLDTCLLYTSDAADE